MMIGLSDLGVTECLALTRVGYVPCGLVVGCSFYDTRWQFNLGFSTGELTTLTRALREVRQRAVADMQAQADALSAEGVVGVRLQLEHHRWKGGHDVARFLAVGTAIRLDEAPHASPELRAAPGLKVGGR